MEIKEEIELLSFKIKDCQNILVAIGDESRQHIILSMMKCTNGEGMRVNDIAKMSNLSRPTVSHHLQILKAAGIISMNRIGTRNYYFFNHNSNSFDKVIDMLNKTKIITYKAGENRKNND